MKTIVIISVMLFGLQACREGDGNAVIDKDATVTSILTLDSVPNVNTLQPSDKTNSETILGFWAIVGEENASFEIKKGEIFYPEHFKSYKYKIIGKDSIEIKYDDFSDIFTFKTKGIDTLVLTGDEQHMYYRFKK